VIFTSFPFASVLDLGLASILGLIAGVIPVATLYFTAPGDKLASLKIPFISMSVSIGGLVLTIAILNIYYGLRIHRLSHIPLEQYLERKGFESTVKLLDSCTKLLHNTLHHLRHMIYALSEENYKISRNKKGASKVKAADMLASFSTYLITLAGNLKIFFDKSTEDDCSVCIKLIKKVNDEILIKTLIRDSSSYRERKEHDFSDSRHTKIYPASENTAFNMICSEDFKDTFFVSDNLGKLYDEGKYTNSNPRWQTYYNATLVVPISIIPNKEFPHERHILGFLCVDNKRGGLNRRYLIDLLAGFSDILFNLFLEYDEFIKNNRTVVEGHEQIGKYVNWD